MNVLSLFDGMSCGQLALKKAGIPIDNYFASELDKYAISVTQHNHPNTIQLGDVCKVKGEDLPKIDLLIGGSPCQGFSFAGKQLNFNDPRSALFFEYVRLLKELNPRYFLLENVVMKKEFQDVISEQLGVQPVMINSSLVSAQNRKRLYWTNIPNIAQPEDKGIVLSDIIEEGFVDRSKSFCLDANYYKGDNLTAYFEKHRRQIVFKYPTIGAIRGRYILDGVRQDGKYKTSGLTTQYIEFRTDGKTNTLTTVSKDNVIVPFSLDSRIPASEFPYRNLTPIECERLQTVPDNYTQVVSNTQRYKMLGNGWTVDVIAHIFKGLTNNE